MIDVEIEAIPAMRLAGLPHAGSYDRIGTTFERAAALAGPLGIAGPAAMVGIYYDDPDSVPEAKLRAFAGLALSGEPPLPAPLQQLDLPAQTCAVHVHVGPYAELPTVYRALFRDWLPASGREAGDAPAFEIYLNDPRGLPPTEWRTKVCIPLAG